MGDGTMQRIMLNIRTQPALIGLETELARAPVRTQLASFSIDNTPSMLSIEKTYPRIEIDSREGWAELGVADPLELNRRLRDQGWRDAAFGTEHVVTQGDRLATFWEPGNKVEEMAAEEFPEQPFSLFVQPTRPVLVNATDGELKIDYRCGTTAVRLGEKPELPSYKAGYARVYLRQQAAIEITWQRLDLRT